MLKIELANLQFHGYHGVHEDELKTGGNFEVNMSVYFMPEYIPVRLLQDTVDYTLLYELVKQRMQTPAKLLETLATEIAQQVLDKFIQVEEITVEIKKLNPPIAFFNGTVAASFTLKRK